MRAGERDRFGSAAGARPGPGSGMNWLPGSDGNRLYRLGMNKTALLFAGQGAQHVGMGKDLADQIPAAREWFERANGILGFDLAALCFSGPEADLTRTEAAQPGIYLLGWIAFDLLRKRAPGFEFQAAAGLSLGEFTALAAAGGMSFEEGLRLVRQRGQWMQEACEATRGGMAAVLGLDLDATRAVCAEAGVELANLNCPGQVVISGPIDSIQRACELAKARGAKRALPLPVAGAYHSRLMAAAQPRLRQALEAVPLRWPAAPVIANVTARPHESIETLRERLVEQVTAPVRWEESIRYLLGEGFNRFVELGPGKALSGFMKRIAPAARVVQVSDVPSLEAAVQAWD